MKLQPLVALLALAAGTSAMASPADYIYMPGFELGEREIELKSGTGRQGNAPRENDTSIGFGYGAKEWWFTEFSVNYKMDNFQHTKYDALEWENIFQLTEQGKYPVDLGLVTEIEHPRYRIEGWETKWGPLLQTEFGKWQLNGNVLFERSYHSAAPSATALQYQWQLKYRWQQAIELGFQGFGNLGQWDNWLPADQRDHRLGPAIFGKLPLGNRQAIKYDAAWLLGESQAAYDHTLRLQLEYEF